MPEGTTVSFQCPNGCPRTQTVYMDAGQIAVEHTCGSCRARLEIRREAEAVSPPARPSYRFAVRELA